MKKVKTGALLLGLLLVLTGCGKNEAKDVDPSVLADTLRNAITFQDELEAVDAAAMGRMYEVDEADIEAFKVYTGTGATAEEIAVFKAKDEQAAGRIYQAMQTRVENQKAAFENYNPNEMKKLQDPLVRKTGVTVVLCVSDDTPAAEKAVREALG